MQYRNPTFFGLVSATILMLFAVPLYAQSDSLSKYDNTALADMPLLELASHVEVSMSTFNPTTGMWTGGGSSKAYEFRIEGSDYRPIGSGGSNLEEYLEKVPSALEHLETYRTKKVGGTMLMIGGGLVAAVSVATASKKTGEQTFDPRTGQMEDKYEIEPGGYAGIGIGLVGALIGGIMNSSASKYVKKAVITYNKEVENARNLSLSDDDKSVQQSAFKLNVRPAVTSTYTGIGINISF